VPRIDRPRVSLTTILRRLLPIVFGIVVVTAGTSALGIDVFGSWWQTAAMLAFIAVLAWWVPLLFSSADQGKAPSSEGSAEGRSGRDERRDLSGGDH
jgi:hypothetical protein